MKTKILLLLTLLFTTCMFSQTGNKAANSDFTESNQEVLIEPSIFYGTIGVLFDFSKEQNVLLTILDSQNKKVFEKKYENIKNTNFKLDLSELKNGKYNLRVSTQNGDIIYRSDIEKKE